LRGLPQQQQQQPQPQPPQQQAHQQPQQQEPQQQTTTAEAASEEVNVEALAAEWSTRRRASPFVAASRRLPGRSSLDGDDAYLQSQAAASMNMQLDSRMLEEGGALAMGAAAGAAAATAAEQPPRPYSKSGSMRGSLHRVLKAAVAAVGSPRLSKPLVDVFARRSADGRRRQSAAGSDYVMPPVPMHPADKVLSMQVSVGCVFVFFSGVCVVGLKMHQGRYCLGRHG
jgi:hypothetical protein